MMDIRDPLPSSPRGGDYWGKIVTIVTIDTIDTIEIIGSDSLRVEGC